MTVKNYLFFCCVAIWLGSILTTTASAQVWISSSSGLWQTGANWSGGVPTSGASTALVFTNSQRLLAPQTATNNLANPFLFNSINLNTRYGFAPFSAPFNALTIDGDGLSAAGVNPQIMHSSGAAVRFSAAINTGTGLQLSGSSNGHLRIESLSGSGSLTISRTGLGHMILGSSTHTGGVILSSGELAIDSLTSLGTGGLTVNGGSIRMNSFLTPSGLTINNPITANANVLLSGNNSAIFAGVISGNGGFVNQSISGITGRLTAANTYTGETYAGNTPTFSGTTIQVEGANGSILNSSRVSVDRSSVFHLNNADASGGLNGNRVADTTEVNLRSGTLRFTGSNAAASTETIGALRAQGFSTVNVNPGASQIGVLTAASFERVNRGVTLLSGTGVGTGAQGAVGIGTLTLTDTSGYNSNLVGGGGVAGSTTISINPAFIASTASGAVGSTWTTYDAGVRPLNLTTEYTSSIVDGSTSANNVRLTSGPQVINSSTTVNSIILSNAGASPSITYGSISGSGTLNVTSGGIMSAVSGTGVVAPPPLSVANLNFGSQEAVINVTSGATLPFEISSNITGSGGLTKAGFGVLRMTGNVGYTGQLTVNAGTIEYSDPSKLGGSGAVQLNGGGIRNTASTTLNRDIQVGAAHGTIDTSASTTLSATGVIAGNGALIKQGTGTLTLSATNTYSGGTSVAAGVLQYSSSANLGTGGIVLGPGGTLRNTAATTLDKTVTLAAGSGARTIDTPADLTMNANIIENASVTNALDLTKTGAGILSLNGNNTFRGAMNVNAGGVKVNGFLDQVNSGSVGVNVASGAKLGGNGVIARDVAFADSSIIIPGASIGTLTINGTGTFAGNSIFELEAGSGLVDRLDIDGLIAFNGGTSILRMFDLGGADFSSPKVFLSGKSVTGAIPTWSFDFSNAPSFSSLGLQVQQNGNTFSIISSVPEPSSALLLALAVPAFLSRRLRKAAKRGR